MRKMKTMRITYKDIKRAVDTFTCDIWSINQQNSLLRLSMWEESNNTYIVTTIIRLPEILKIEIS